MPFKIRSALDQIYVAEMLMSELYIDAFEKDVAYRLNKIASALVKAGIDVEVFSRRYDQERVEEPQRDPFLQHPDSRPFTEEDARRIMEEALETE